MSIGCIATRTSRVGGERLVYNHLLMTRVARYKRHHLPATGPGLSLPVDRLNGGEKERERERESSLREDKKHCLGRKVVQAHTR